jgi:hypothetical protein
MSPNVNFQEAWTSYRTGPHDFNEEFKLLSKCQQTSKTVDELIQVFEETCKCVAFETIRPQTLKKMIYSVRTVDEAKRVYALVSKRGRRGYAFPAREREARARFQRFGVGV